MRILLLSALVLLAVPADAQTEEPRETRRVVIEVDSAASDGARFEVEIEREPATEDGDGPRVLIRRRASDGDDEQIVELQIPDRERLAAMMERVVEGTMAVFRSDDGDTVVERMMDDRSASPETRARIRALEAQSEALAQRARESDGQARRDAIRELDTTLSELFEARAQARRERVDALRDRAEALDAQADQAEAALADRQSRREEMIQARRRALMDGDDW